MAAVSRGSAVVMPSSHSLRSPPLLICGPFLSGVVKVGILGRQAVGVGGITFPERQVARGSCFCELTDITVTHTRARSRWLARQERKSRTVRERE